MKIHPDHQKSPFHMALLTLKLPMILMSVLMSSRYLHWRLTETLNHQSPVHFTISLLLVLAELFGTVSMLLFFAQTHQSTEHASPPVRPEELPGVDVLITVYDEPKEVLFRTLAACSALDYPKDRLALFVCDDGGRPEIRGLAERFGCRYLSRTDRRHAKAGNLNNALRHARAELLFILDCDHIPVKSFLLETVGFFKDPKLAFVQTPHHFYNPDCHQRNLSLEDDLTNEQDLFFQIIMPGRDWANSAIFAGSSAVFRRSALESIGGFRTEVAIEDLHTGMELHARGYRSLFYNRILSGALSPENYAGYLIQRDRWTRGGVQLFILDNPLFKVGLSLMQRLHYLASILYFFTSWARLIYLVAPLSYLLFSYNPIVSPIMTLMGYFLPHVIFAHLAFNVVSREYRNPFWSDVYETGTVFLLSWTILVTLLRPDKLLFKVTPKGRPQHQHEVFHWYFVLPQIVLMGLLLAGLIKGAYSITQTGMGLDAMVLSTAWTVFNVILLGCSIEVAREHPQKRLSYRLNRQLPCQVDFKGGSVKGATLDISEGGALLALPGHLRLPKHVTVHFRGADSPTGNRFEAVLSRSRWQREGGTQVAVRFENMTEAVLRDLVVVIFGAPDTWESVTRPFRDSLRAFAHMVSTPVRKRLQKKVQVVDHHYPDFPMRLSCELSAAGRTIAAVTESLSAVRAVLKLETAAELPPRAELRLPHAGGEPVAVQAALRRLSRDGETPTVCEAHFLHPKVLDLHLVEHAPIPGEAT